MKDNVNLYHEEDTTLFVFGKKVNLLSFTYNASLYTISESVTKNLL